jgi:hypothetical protein
VSFHTLSILTCIAALLLALGWLTVGKLMLQRWLLPHCCTVRFAAFGMAGLQCMNKDIHGASHVESRRFVVGPSPRRPFSASAADDFA